MTRVKHYVDLIDEELDGAKEYAESYVDCKSRGNSENAAKYKSIAKDELNHALIIHNIATADIEQLEKTFIPTVEMEEEWDKSHKEYVEKSAWIEKMLEM